MAIEAKIINASTNYGLLKELHKVDDQMAKADIKLKDEIKMKLTIDEKMTHNNVCLTYWVTTESPKKSRGKVSSLLLSRCTQVLVNTRCGFSGH